MASLLLTIATQLFMRLCCYVGSLSLGGQEMLAQTCVQVLIACAQTCDLAGHTHLLWVELYVLLGRHLA